MAYWSYLSNRCQDHKAEVERGSHYIYRLSTVALFPYSLQLLPTETSSDAAGTGSRDEQCRPNDDRA